MKRTVFARCKFFVGGMVLALGILCMASSSYAQNPHDQGYHPNFPRLGLIYIGGDQTYPETAWPVMAKFNVVIMGAGYENWGRSSRTRESRVDAIHSLSKVDTKVFQYVEMESQHATNAFDTATGEWTTVPNSSYNIYAHFTPIIDANNWWLYNAGTATTGSGIPGPEVVSSGKVYSNSATYVMNLTHGPWTRLDPSTGFSPYQAAANYAYHEFIAGDIAGQANTAYNAAADMDGIYLDNCWQAPYNAGDWNLDGVTEQLNGKNGWVTDPEVVNSYRQGNAEFAQKIHALGAAQGKMAICNNGNWPQAASFATPPAPPTGIGPLYRQFDGGVDEAVIGASFSKETYAGFDVAMQYYIDLMAMVAEPKLEIFNQEGLKANGSDPYDSTPYRAMRYGICMALMNDGYYDGETAPSHIGPSYGTKVWFDEYDAGGLGQGYLGQPVTDWKGAVQTQARWNYGPLGVWAREFEGGIAIVNPKGNGPVTLTIQDLGGQIWKHFLGTEDPDTNNGEDVTDSITLADRDGVILLRRHPLRNGNNLVPTSEVQ